MTITIPIPAVVEEAIAKRIYETMYPPQSHPAWEYVREPMKQTCRKYARAAAQALLAAWPGVECSDHSPARKYLHLPLPQDPENGR